MSYYLIMGCQVWNKSRTTETRGRPNSYPKVSMMSQGCIIQSHGSSVLAAGTNTGVISLLGTVAL